MDPVLQSLAQRANAHFDAALTLPTSDGPVRIVHPAGTVVEPLAEALRERGAEVDSVSTQDLEDPASLYGVPKVVLAFPTGEVLDAASMRAVEHVAFARPKASYWVVLVGADIMEEPGDLEIVETLARRVYTRPEARRKGNVDLVEQRCLVWTEQSEDVPEWLRDRLEADRSALIGWVEAPLPDTTTDQLAAHALRHHLDAEETESSSSAPSPPPDEDRERVLRDVRAASSKIERDADAIAEQLVSTLRTSLRDAEVDMRAAPSEAAARLRSWAGQAGRDIAAQMEKLHAEVAFALEPIEWAPLRTLLRDRGTEVPDGAIRGLESPAPPHLITLPAEPSVHLPSPSPRLAGPTRGRGPVPPAVLAGAVGTVTTATTMFLRLANPLLSVAVGAGAAYIAYNATSQSVGQSEPPIDRASLRLTAELDRYSRSVAAVVEDSIGQYKRDQVTDLRAVETALQQASPSALRLDGPEAQQDPKIGELIRELEKWISESSSGQPS